MNDQTLSPSQARFFTAPLAEADPAIAAVLSRVSSRASRTGSS